MIAGWCWDLVEPYLRRNLLNRGVERPTRKQVLEEFARVWPDFTATIGVQEPHAGTIRFKVVRPGPEKMPEGRIQYVEHLTPEQIWRADNVNRLGLQEVFVVAKNPAQTAARWARFAGLIPTATRDGVTLETARGRIFIGKRATIAKKLGHAPAAPAIAGYALACRHPEKLAARCREAGIKVQKRGKRYAATLPKALGGAWLFG